MSKQELTFGKSAVITTFSKILAYAISLVTTMLLSRFRTLQEYGTHSQMLMVINLFSSVIMLGLPSSLNYFIARAETIQEKRDFISLYYSLNTTVSLVVGTILVLSVPLIESYFKNDLISKFSYFICLYPWAKIINEGAENLFIVFKRPLILMIYRVSHSIIMLVCILIIQALSLGFSHYVFAFLLIEAIYALFVYLMAGKFVKGIHISFNPSLLKKVMVFSVPLGLSLATGTLKAEMDKLTIGFLFSTEELALYANAAKELPLTIIAASFTAVLLPIIAGMIKDKKIESAIELWKDTTVFCLIINVYFAIGLFFFSKEAVMFLYSEKYVPGKDVFAVYSLLLILRSTYFGMILNVTGNTKIILKGSIISLVINFVLNIACYLWFGFIGPAIATVVCTLWNSIYQLQHTSKVTQVKFVNVFPFKEAFKIILINLLLGLIFFAFKTYSPLCHYIGEIPTAFLCAVIWCVFDIVIFRKDLRHFFAVMKKS